MRPIVTKQGKFAEWIEPDGLLILKGWARDGLTNLEIAKNCGVAPSTFGEWLNKFPVIKDTLKEGRRPVLVEVEDTFFEKKLKGYFVEEEIVVGELHGQRVVMLTGEVAAQHVQPREHPAAAT